jgi:CRISPR-associated protein Csb3
MQLMSLDWWYETLDQDGEIAEKSAWKMYAGNQKPQGIIQKMVTAARETMNKRNPETITQLIALHQGMTGRFGFDCRSSRKALDAGFSANDIPDYQAATYPFLELLAVIGAYNFFPARTKPSHGNESTRGWAREKGSQYAFQYALWMSALPISLARVAAARAALEDTSKIIPMKSFRSSTGQDGKDQYSYLTLADRTSLNQGE